jgi:hypothetical protein
MSKFKKSILHSDWLEIKEMYEKNTNGTDEYGKNFPIGGEFEKLTSLFLDKVGFLTGKFGYECVIDDIHMNLWKERIWSVIENGGLLAPIAWKGDLEIDDLEVKEKQDEEYYKDEFNNIEEYEPSDEELESIKIQ